MKIRDFRNTDWLPQTPPAAPAGTVRNVERRDFHEVMQEQFHGDAADRLATLADDIHRQGLVLAERRDILELKRYKKLISDFMHEAVHASYAFQKKNMRDGRGRHRVYAIIKRINESLEALTKKVLSEETDNLQLMASIDDINGMLVDLVI